MNLQLSLIIRIILTAFICLVANAAYVLYQNDQQSQQQAVDTAERIEKQIQTQIRRIYHGHDHSTSFPDANLWQDINGLPGSCIQFESLSSSRQRSVCNEETNNNQMWPSWFGQLYQQFFNPNFQAKRKVVFFAISFGTVVVTLNKQSEISRAWSHLKGLMGLTLMTVLALASLVYITVSRVLKPAQLIVNGLEKMSAGQLETRIPSFEISEWKRTSDAINQLAISQQQVMTENQQLALNLMNAQEEEHRYIARELHDEFGQCLAGINAINSSINQTAKQQAPDLVEESDKVSEITRHMMDVLRSLLTRLRPAEVDDFGLTSSLKKLVASWNNRTHGETIYQLTITGNIEQLVEPFPVNIYRIIQECLTNIAKHAQASKASIAINYQINSSFQLIISDDGIATETTILDNKMGMGLIGIRERVSALAGQLEITSQSGSGMTILITLPIHTYEQSS